MKISSTQSDFLNISRWVASWLVLAEHVRALVFADYAVCNPGVMWQPFYFLTGFGHEAVMVFFVISGFLVGGKVADNFRTRTFQWKKYLADRISRLYAVLFVALLLGGLMDWIGLNYANDFGLYNNSANQPIALITKDISADLSAGTFIANAIFLQTVAAPTFGSNGPLWSLANEWWYYLLFPLLLNVPAAHKLSGKALSLCLVVGIVWLLPGLMLVLFSVWLLGVIVAKATKPWVPWFFTLPMMFVAMVVARVELIALPVVGNALVGLCFGLLLNSLVARQGRYPLHQLSLQLADFSYSLYLLHLPFVLLVLSALQTCFGIGLKMPPSGSSMMLFLAVCLLAIGWSWLAAQLTENRTSQLRQRLYALAGVNSASRPAAQKC